MIAPQKGHFKYALAVDCETTGLFMNSATPDHNPDTGEYYQPVSWGLVVVDMELNEIVDKLYVEIAHDGVSLWDPGAERVHCLSQQYLKDNGVTEEEAVVLMLTTILQYWGPDSHINLIGHNVATFDMHFLRSMFRRHGVEVLFSQRVIDSSSVMKATFNCNTSDEAFNLLGIVRTDHNALEDAIASAQCILMVRQLWNELVNPVFEE